MEAFEYRIRGASPSVTDSSPGFDSLVKEKHPVPRPGENEVLIRVKAVSLNFRDLWMPTNTYAPVSNIPDGTIPVSDGAGEVVEIGSRVTKWKVGDRVAAIMLRDWISGPYQSEYFSSVQGFPKDGMLREYATLHEQALVEVPSPLNFEEASCLPCAAVTAWNALYGSGRPVRAGDTVVTQGTGGVSLFAVQFALAGGAEVIATTSSAAKAEALTSLGVKKIINYKETPQWGEEVKRLSHDGKGAQIVVEIGGNGTIEQSYKATRPEGQIAAIGVVSNAKERKSTFSVEDAFRYIATFRRIIVGSRESFEVMNRSIEANDIKPVLDQKVFSFDEAKEAFRYMWDVKHVGKVVIRV